MAHAQKPDFVFRRNGRFHLKRQGRQFSRLLAAKVCASAVVMLDTPCSEVATHSIRQFPLHFPSRASPCAITFQLDSTFHAIMLYMQQGKAREVVQMSGERILFSIQAVLSYLLRRIFHKGLERFFGYFGNYVSPAKGNNAVKLKGEDGCTS